MENLMRFFVLEKGTASTDTSASRKCEVNWVTEKRDSARKFAFKTRFLPS